MPYPSVQTLADVLKDNSDAPGVVCAGGGPSYSRGQLQTRIEYVANLLRNSGIKAGDTISIAKANTVSGPCFNDELRRPLQQLMTLADIMKTCLCHVCGASIQSLFMADFAMPVQVDFIVAFLGVTYARAVAAPLNPNYKLVSLYEMFQRLHFYTSWRLQHPRMLIGLHHAFQDEFKFFMEDAKSKLLLVPLEGNSTAEKAASDLQVSTATLKITPSGGKHPCS